MSKKGRATPANTVPDTDPHAPLIELLIRRRDEIRHFLEFRYGRRWFRVAWFKWRKSRGLPNLKAKIKPWDTRKFAGIFWGSFRDGKRVPYFKIVVLTELEEDLMKVGFKPRFPPGIRTFQLQVSPEVFRLQALAEEQYGVEMSA
jgi:hypothetical protein